MIEVISGTNRPGSNARKIADIICGYYQELGEDVQVLDLADLPQEIFSPNCYAEKPASFQPFQERILAARGLHVVTPEYNGSFPGVLKYFIDMLKFPESFEHRCVAYTGEAAGLWGGFRSVEQLQMIFNYRNAYNLPERVWIPGVQKQLDAEGKAIVEEKTRAHLHEQCKKFAAFVARNGDEAAKG